MNKLNFHPARGRRGRTMEIELFTERENKNSILNFAGETVADLLKEISVNPETVIVVRKSEVLTEKEILSDKDKIELLSVISGG